MNENQQTLCKVIAYQMYAALKKIPPDNPQLASQMQELVMRHLNRFLHGEQGGIESTCSEVKDS
jgi:hypothetical protein